MNGRAAKMLRRIRMAHPRGKRAYQKLTHVERSRLHAEVATNPKLIYVCPPWFRERADP